MCRWPENLLQELLQTSSGPIQCFPDCHTGSWGPERVSIHKGLLIYSDPFSKPFIATISWMSPNDRGGQKGFKRDGHRCVGSVWMIYGVWNVHFAAWWNEWHTAVAPAVRQDGGPANCPSDSRFIKALRYTEDLSVNTYRNSEALGLPGEITPTAPVLSVLGRINCDGQQLCVLGRWGQGRTALDWRQECDWNQDWAMTQPYFFFKRLPPNSRSWLDSVFFFCVNCTVFFSQWESTELHQVVAVKGGSFSDWRM